ncbi:sensor histidine kinase [Paenisporosarcina sp. TG20]|uniref:ATP-binding protein n=1 Tax=Paenisporosarcina sp. TG20 TaxID=1211706 RepID=UPI000364267F|nr:sensor histidine kinase [Paenisporosarcina sp. TG20]
MKNRSLQSKIFVYGALFVTAISLLIGTSFYFTMSNSIEQQIGNRALSIAVTTAERPDVVAGFESEEPSTVLQPIAEKVRILSGAEYVVIGNTKGIRYAHPIIERIGQKMVGDDNERTLINGESYISEATGTLGPALRGKTPIKNNNGEIIGVISVGFLKEDISNAFFEYVDTILTIVLLAILFGVIGSTILARSIKKVLFNLEPAEIAHLYNERNTLFESVREGIIMVDKNSRISMVNPSAYEMLSIKVDTILVGLPIENVLPNTLLPHVLLTGEKQFDRPMVVRGKKVIVNRMPIIVGKEIVGAVSSFRLQSDFHQLTTELSQVKLYTEALRSQTHEYQNFLYSISGLIQLNSLDEALHLIHDETQENQSLIQFVTKRLQDAYLGGLVIGLFNRARELKIRFILDEDSNMTKLPKHLEKSLFISIIGNLVTNAFEAVEHLKESDRIVRLLITDIGLEILLEIEDSGEGLSSHILEHIFKSRVSTKEGQDRGYGLVKVFDNIVDLGGAISIEKGDLGGALFIISIPKGGFMYDQNH